MNFMEDRQDERKSGDKKKVTLYFKNTNKKRYYLAEGLQLRD